MLPPTAPAAPTPAPAPRRRWVLRIAAALLGALALASVAAWWLLDPSRLTPFVERILDEELRGDVSIARVAWVPPLGVRAEGFVVTATTGATVLTVQEIDATIDPSGLLGGRVRVPRAAARGVRARLERGSRARPYALVEAFLPRRVSTSTAPPAIEVAIDALSVTDAEIDVAEPGLAVAVRGATVTRGAFTLARGDVTIDADLDVAHVRAAQDGIPALEGPALVRGVRVTYARETRAARLDVGEARLDLTGGGPATLTARGTLAPLATDDPIGARARVSLQAPVAHPTMQDALVRWVPDPSFLATTGTVALQADVDGALPLPALTATVAGSGLVAFGRPLDTARALVRLTPGRVDVDPFVIVAAGGTVSGAVGMALASRTIDADLRFTRAPLAEFVSTAPPELPARVDGVGRFSGTASRGAISGELSGDGARLALRGDLACDGCTLGAAQTRLDLAIVLSHARPGPHVARRIPGASADRVQLVARARGTVAHPRARGELTIEGARHRAVTPRANAAVEFELDGPRLTVVEATLTSSVGRAAARGEVALPLWARAGQPVTLALDVRTTSVALAPLSRGYARGSLSATGRIEGTAAAPTARIDGLLQGLVAVDRVAFAPARFSARAEGGRYTLARTTLQLVDGGELTVEGSTDGSQIDARAIASSLPVARVATMAMPGSPSPIGDLVSGGLLDVGVVVRGTLEAPQLLVEAEATQLVLAGATFSRLVARAEGPLEALVADTRLVGVGGTLTLEGTADVRGQRLSGGRLVARHLAIPAIAALRGVAGRVDADIELAGAWRYPEARGRLRLREVTMGERSLGLPPIVAELSPTTAPGIYAVELDVGQALVVRGLLALEPGFGFNGYAEARGLSLRPAVEAAIALGWVEEGGALSTADATLGATGELTYDAGGLRATVDLTSAALSASQLGLELTKPARIAYDSGGLTIGRIQLDGRRGGIVVEGTAGETLDLRARVGVNAAVLSLASRQIQQATGRFTVDATVKGRRDAPVVEASLTIDEPVSIRPRAGVREILLTKGRIRTSRARVDVEGLDGEIGGGQFRLTGSVDLDGARPASFDLAFDGSGLPLRTRSLGVEANVFLRLRGAADQPRLSGRLDIVRARYAKQFRLENFVFVAADEGTSAPLAETLPWLADLDLDLRARSAGDIELEVDANAIQLALQLGADVTVQGTPLAPRLGGRVRAESGRLEFPRASLDVTTVDIDLDPFPAPGISGISLRLEASGEVTTTERSRTQVVDLVLEGPLEQLSLDLRSEGLDRLAVLSLLITGRSTLDRDGALAFAGSQLAAPLTSYLEDQLEKALNLGLRLDAEVSSTSVKVTASRELTRRLVIEGSFQRDFDAEGTTTTAVRALLYLFDRAFLEARTSSTRSSVTPSDQAGAGEAASTSVELKYQLLGR